jgi:hypothetical protein
MSEINRKPLLVELLVTLIQADLIKTLENMPHLNLAERRIALGRALRRGVVDDLVRDMITEEVRLAEFDRAELTEELADALLATMPIRLEG